MLYWKKGQMEIAGFYGRGEALKMEETSGRPQEFEFQLVTADDAQPGWHEALELFFVLQGGGWLHLEEGAAGYAIREGDLFAVNGYQMRCLALAPGARALCLRVSAAFLAVCCPEIKSPQVNCKSFLFAEDRQGPFDALRQDLALAFRCQYKSESDMPLHLRARIVALLDDLFQNFLEEDKAGERADTGRLRLRAATDYIYRHYKENIALADLAEHTYLSAPYISRMFQKHLGVTFTAYLTRVRLLHAAALLPEDITITEIAYETGFSSTNALIEAFKQQHGVTPGQFRKAGKTRREAPQRGAEAWEGFSTQFASLMKYAEEASGMRQPVEKMREISADTAEAAALPPQNWKRLINAGYAKELLNGSVQKQLIWLQKKIGYAYIRCKGLLDDDMMLCVRDVLGNLVPNYVYVDEAVDFILSIGAKPLLELSHMPVALAKNKSTLFHRPAYLSAPADEAAWAELIAALMEHFTRRYGEKEVKQWMFAPWTSPDFSSFGLYTLEEYAATYTASYRAIKGACGAYRVCGPGCNINSPEIVTWFLELSQREQCVPDVLAFHSFSTIQPGEEKDGLRLEESSEAFQVGVSGDEAFLRHQYKKVCRLAQEKGLGGLPVILDEWSNNVWQRDLCNDTSYKSAYLFKSILENYDTYDAMGYFNATDQLDEIAPSPDLFHGGFGLFTRSGLPKGACRALELLNRAGSRLLARGEGYFVTMDEGQVQIFLYNYCHYDLLYRYRNTTNLTKTERYKVFNEKPPVAYHIRLRGIARGTHDVRRYSIGPKGGSAYDEWLAMGAPAPMTEEEERLLAHRARPAYDTFAAESTGAVTLKTTLQPHEVQFITIQR